MAQQVAVPVRPRRSPPTRVRRPRLRGRVALWHVGVLVAVLVIIYPVLWMLGTSFKPAVEVISSIRPWPTHPTLDNYPDGWTSNPNVTFGRFFVNSLIVATGTVAGNLFGCSLAAFAFARLRFRFRGFFFAIMIGTILLPYHVLLIPQYVIFKQFGWINTFLPLIVPHFLATEAFFIFLITQFMRGIPAELDEAAAIDGCGPWRTYLRIVLPLTRPALITTSIFSFIWAWNDFFPQLIYLNDTQKFTVPRGLSLFIDQTSAASYGPMMAMSMLAMVPVLLFFLAFQRLLVEGAATTGLKG
ncbi:MAG: carbohydrate ABC transporter permease [Micromonosporaceae bacterium]|nr:carbohydrate ABC transporter permease [Micromonosporaceae bacterium]